MDVASREKLLEALKRSIPKKQIFENAPMSRYTTLKLGGPADVLVQIASVEQLSCAYAAAREAGVEVSVLGNGSNLLVRDGGVRGLIIQLGELFAEVSDPVPLPDGRVALTAQGGATLQKLCNCGGGSRAQRPGICQRHSGNGGRRGLYECRRVWRRDERRSSRM